MSAVSKSHTFVPGTDIESAQANQNFDDLVNYTNNEVIVRDASKAFTAIPSGPGTDPTSPNQFARKQYVDQRVKIDGTTPFTGIPSGPATNPTTANQFTRKQYVDDSAVTPLTQRPTINNNATGVKMTSQTVVTATDANGDVTVTFPAGHLTTCTNVVAVSGNINASATQISTISMIGFTNTQFNVRVFRVNTTSPFGVPVLEPAASQGVKINYIATGT